MEREDFAIGTRFTTGIGEWICVDVGMKYIYAVRSSDYAQIVVTEDETSYIVAFDHYDLGGCEPSVVDSNISTTD